MNWRGEVAARARQGLITAARFRLPERWPWARVDVAAADGGAPGRTRSRWCPIPTRRTRAAGCRIADWEPAAGA